MDIVPKDEFEMLLSEQARATRALMKPVKAKHKLLAAADEAFDLIGGVPRFALWADQSPSQFYKLYSKTLPRNIEISGDITIIPALPPSALDGDPDEAPLEPQASLARLAPTDTEVLSPPPGRETEPAVVVDAEFTVAGQPEPPVPEGDVGDVQRRSIPEQGGNSDKPPARRRRSSNADPGGRN